MEEIGPERLQGRGEDGDMWAGSVEHTMEDPTIRFFRFLL